MSRARAEARTTAQIVRAYRGPALFSFGFRPFFLLAVAFSALAVPLWVVDMLGGGGDTLAAAISRDWHVHEMLFGYTGAVIVGYMIIAAANWTGRYPVAGAPVIGLAALWIAGRVAMIVAEPASRVAGAVDAAFLVVFAAALWREQIAARNGRNLVPCVVVTLLAAANIAFHLRHDWPELGTMSERLAIGLITLLIAVMGGRLVPSFTRNWLAQQLQPEPAAYDRFNTCIAVLTATALLAWQIVPSSPLAGAPLLLAGAGTLARLARWRGWAARSEPLVWSLHLGYFWIAAGLTLLGLSILLPATIPYTSAVHALTAGAIGTMTLAMMTRTALSHTGRARRADEATLLIYLLVTMAAAMRVLAPFWIAAHLELFALSAACWSLAFALFVVSYGPILVRPFHRTKKVAPGAEAAR